jgi:hypothetical protein
MAVVARRAVRTARKGVPHKLTPQRAAQIHRWQLLGAAARKGKKRAAKSAHHQQTARQKKAVVGTYASAAKWGVSKLILPTSLVTPIIPGYQPGDRTSFSPRRRRR